MTCCEKCWEEAESMSRYTILTQKEDTVNYNYMRDRTPLKNQSKPEVIQEDDFANYMGM